MVEVKKLTDKQELEALRKRFVKANRMRKRVMVAKDVIKQLDAKKFIATSGIYFSFDYAYRQTRYDYLPKNIIPQITEDLSDVINDKQCMVCAIGAAFCSAVRLKDKVTVGDVGSPSTLYGVAINDNNMIDYLSNIFSRDEMRMFERIFERSYYHMDEYEFGCIVSDQNDNTVLRLIMENIVANRGEFRYDILPVRDEKTGKLVTPGYKG